MGSARLCIGPSKRSNKGWVSVTTIGSHSSRMRRIESSLSDATRCPKVVRTATLNTFYWWSSSRFGGIHGRMSLWHLIFTAGDVTARMCQTPLHNTRRRHSHTVQCSHHKHHRCWFKIRAGNHIDPWTNCEGLLIQCFFRGQRIDGLMMTRSSVSSQTTVMSPRTKVRQRVLSA